MFSFLRSNLDGIVHVSDELARIPILFMDTAGCHMSELETHNQLSKGNEGDDFMQHIHITLCCL